MPVSAAVKPRPWLDFTDPELARAQAAILGGEKHEKVADLLLLDVAPLLLLGNLLARR